MIAVDGIRPGRVATPRDIADLAATLSAASQSGTSTVICGGGTKLAWGRTPADVGLLVSMAGLHAVVAHRHGDLTATVEGGATLAAVNRTLAAHGQWLPLDSAFPEATIGGIVATNDAGPLRHRFGTPRDLLIGVTLALADGRIARSGGTVVKNVAGYDLGRLVSGSFGSLAAIATATFKLAPLPASSGTLGVFYQDAAAFARDSQVLAANQFELTALDVQAVFRQHRREYRLLVRVASSPAATDAQLAAAQSLVTGDAETIRGGAEDDLWRDQVAAPWLGDAVTIRLAWLPAAIGTVLTLLDDTGRATGTALTFTGRAAIGSGLLRVDGPPEAAVAVVERLRRSDVAGNVVVLRAPAAVKASVDVWGTPRDAAPVMLAIKQALDPRGVLNAGRGPI